MALVLNAKEFAAYHARLAEQFRPTVMRGVRSGAARAVSYLVEQTRAAPPANPRGIGSGGAVDTGAFIRSWRAVPLPEGAALINTSPYAPVIEYGRRSGSRFPPKQALIAWIRRRLLTKPRTKMRKFGPRDSAGQDRAKADKARLESAIKRTGAKDRKFGPRRQPKPVKPIRGKKRTLSSQEQAERLYFPIARAIARRGLIGRKIVTSERAQQWILELVRREVAEELVREWGRQ